MLFFGYEISIFDNTMILRRRLFMARKKFQTLTEQMYYILLALTNECCGVDITERVKEITHGRIIIGPGTLYSLLADFEQEQIIEATKVEGRKKSYIITDKGQELLKQEYERLKRQVEEGRSFFEVAYA